MRITSKGRVTIPATMRKDYGLLPGSAVEFVERDGWVAIRQREIVNPFGIDDFIQRLSGSGSITCD